MINFSTTYVPSPSAFGIIYGNGEVKWMTCREQFHKEVKTTYFLFGGNSTKFIKAAEDKLNIAKEQRCKITLIKGVYYVDASGWWSKHKIRLSLLTILLRCGLNYHGNFQEALYSEDRYTPITRLAIEKFFSGNTFFSGRNTMWVSAFSNNRNIDKLTTEPTQEELEEVSNLSKKYGKIRLKNLIDLV